MTLTVRSASVTGATTAARALTHAEMDANWAHVIESSNQNFTPSGSGASSRTAQEKLRERVSLEDFGAELDGTTDDSAAVTAAITAVTEGGTIECTPGKTCLIDPDTFTHSKIVNFISKGSGKRANSQSKPTFTFKASAGGAYLYKYSNLQTAVASLKHSMRFEGIAFDAGNFSFTDAIVVIEGVSSIEPTNSSITNGTGAALRLREVYEPYFHGFSIIDVDASGANGVVIIDDRYNSDNLLNVNNARFHQCHFEGNQGVYFFAHETSNLDILDVFACKFEWNLGSAPAGGPWSLFEIRNGFRINVHHNSFVNFKNANKYDTLFEMGYANGGTNYACTFQIHNNDYNGVDSSTNELAANGSARGECYSNTVVSSSNVVPTRSISSTQRIRWEPARCLDTGRSTVGSDANGHSLPLSARASAAGIWAMSPHELNVATGSGANDPQFVADGDARNIQGTVLSTGGASAEIARIPTSMLVGFPTGVRLGVRCKSATGAGKINIQYNTTNGTTQTPTSSFTTLWFFVPQSALEILGAGASDRLLLTTGGTNAELVYVDLVYIVPVPWHYEVTFTWNPADIASGAGETSAGVTVTGAALGDHVQVLAPYDLQGLTLTGYVSAADTVTARLDNQTGGNVNLASSAAWKVRVSKA
jgi:hypothetical protein